MARGRKPHKDRVILDPQNLRGLAHPLRVRLLGLLRADGPSTATKLAARLGRSSGATSYHLRQLATYGFVVEDPEHGRGRERWWRATARFTDLPRASAREGMAERRGSSVRSPRTAIARWTPFSPNCPSLVAIPWLVLESTGSAARIGIVAVTEMLPTSPPAPSAVRSSTSAARTA